MSRTENEYAFDVVLSASIRVKAPDEVTARKILMVEVNCADSNLGAWPSGDPILCEVTAEEILGCYEINGEPTY